MMIIFLWSLLEEEDADHFHGNDDDDVGDGHNEQDNDVMMTDGNKT